ncbi:GyrI-like domain-containing protein [Paenibacillus nuruki]|uniref:GyrI-like domain-containing protein n=1 Tax=Paenibacillus nuruki TaxID=1886670 RepID=UPI00280515BD|nr:effector binding domain-containing protein [Paenibacillus nuruki]CAJ1317400.1 AraC-E-bind domain-containing protein [Paenibacillus nuruki]
MNTVATTTIIDLPAFVVHGMGTRTTNVDELGMANARLPQLWASYLHDKAQHPSASSQHAPTYALYTDYESDANGAYTVVIGQQADDHLEQPITRQRPLEITVPASRYMVFTTSKGPVFETVAQTWGTIWNYFEHASEVRTYTGDFEVYESTANPEQAEVKIYIAIQS